jgi:outer membrane protein assembly factor BamB
VRDAERQEALIRSAGLLLALTALATPPAAARTVPDAVWPMFQFAPDHNAVFDRPNWAVAWKADIGANTNGGLTIVGSTIYVESFDHRLYAFDARTGKERWRREFSNVLMNTPVVADGIVVVGTGTAHMLSDSPTFWISGRPQGDSVFGMDAATGSVRWKFDTVGEDMPTGIYVAGTPPQFIFSNGDNHVYALDFRTGKLLWQHPALGVNGMASLAGRGNRVYGQNTLGLSGYFAAQGTPQARMWNWTWALNAADGQYIWTAPYGLGDSSATLGEGLVFVQGVELAQPQGEAAAKMEREIGWQRMGSANVLWRLDVTALDERTGKRVWHYLSAPGQSFSGGSATISADGLLVDNVLYEPLPVARKVAAFQADTGRLLWTFPTEYGVKASPVLQNGLLYFGDPLGYFYVVRASDGSLVEKLKFPGSFAKTPAVIVGRTIYVTNSLYLYAFRISDLLRGDVTP